MTAPFVWSLAPVPQAASQARRLLRERWGHLPSGLLDPAQLVASELVTNAVRHGAGAVTMRLWPGTDAVRIEVTDQSPHLPEARESGIDAEGGRGLHVVEALASRWGACRESHPPGKTVWCELEAR